MYIRFLGELSLSCHVEDEPSESQPWQSREGWMQLAGLRSALARDNELHSKAGLVHRSSLMLLCAPSSRSLCPALPRLTHLSFSPCIPGVAPLGSIWPSSESHYSRSVINHPSNQLLYTSAGREVPLTTRNQYHQWVKKIECSSACAVIDPRVDVWRLLFCWGHFLPSNAC